MPLKSNQPIFLEEEEKRKEKTKFATTILICTTYLLLLYLKTKKARDYSTSQKVLNSK